MDLLCPGCDGISRNHQPAVKPPLGIAFRPRISLVVAVYMVSQISSKVLKDLISDDMLYGPDRCGIYIFICDKVPIILDIDISSLRLPS